MNSIQCKPILGGALMFAIVATIGVGAEANARQVGAYAGGPVSPALVVSGTTCWQETGGGVAFLLNACDQHSNTGVWEVPMPIDSTGSHSASFFLDTPDPFGNGAKCAVYEETPSGTFTNSPYVPLASGGTSITTASVTVVTDGALYGACDLSEGYDGQSSEPTAAPKLHTVVWNF
jgi:hypothetical protein